MQSRRIVKLIVILWIVALSHSLSSFVYAEELPAPVKEKIEAFFQQVSKGEVQVAIDKIIEGGAIGKDPEQVKNLVTQILNAHNVYGVTTGSAYIKSVTLSDSLCKTIYISKHTFAPLKWTFVFYKNTTDWILINIEFDNNIEDLL